MNRFEEDQQDVMHRQQEITNQSHPMDVLGAADDRKHDLQCGDSKDILQRQQTSLTPDEQGLFELVFV